MFDHVGWGVVCVVLVAVDVTLGYVEYLIDIVVLTRVLLGLVGEGGIGVESRTISLISGRCRIRLLV